MNQKLLKSGRMRVAVPSQAPGGLEAMRSLHFGDSECYTLVDIEEGKPPSATVVRNNVPCEGNCGSPVKLMARHGVHAVVVDCIGRRPLSSLEGACIAVYAGFGGSVADVVRNLTDGLLDSHPIEDACEGI